MTIEGWDPDQALLLPGSDVDEDEDEQAGATERYGVTGWESSHHEPLSVALSQEEPDSASAADDADDQWLEVEEGDAFPGRLVPDAQEADDDYAVAVVDPAEYAPEELAMHIVGT